jgi:hypothetical protein
MFRERVHRSELKAPELKYVFEADYKWRLFTMSKQVKGLAVSIVLFMAVVFSNAQSTEELPYVYYYSLEQQAFVIERVDGSERNMLAPFIIPEQDVVTLIALHR